MRTPKELKARYKALFESDDGEVGTAYSRSVLTIHAVRQCDKGTN
jgi:hypothetical protein